MFVVETLNGETKDCRALQCLSCRALSTGRTANINARSLAFLPCVFPVQTYILFISHFLQLTSSNNQTLQTTYLSLSYCIIAWYVRRPTRHVHGTYDLISHVTSIIWNTIKLQLIPFWLSLDVHDLIDGGPP
jgi:hypothetical protein